MACCTLPAVNNGLSYKRMPAASAHDLTTASNGTERQNERNVAACTLRLQEQEALLRVHATKDSQRPHNTHVMYAPKALEFLEWLKTMGYPDEQVNESRLVLFLTHIGDRPTRKRGRKRSILTEESIISIEQRCGRDAGLVLQNDIVGHATVASYVNAVMDLWRVQYSLGTNSILPIRPSSVKEILKQKKVAAVRVEEENFQDAGAKTMADTPFSGTTVQEIVDEMFNLRTEAGLKYRADILLSLGLSSRGDNIRRLCLPHIGLIEFENEGVCGAKLLRTVWRKSKKNQYGNVQETALLRHKFAQRCPFGALALYFFHRWQVGDEPWPDFSERRLWYPVYVLKGSSPTTQSSYSQQYAAINIVYSLLGVQSTVKTQLGRKHASQAESYGASAASVDKQGHWATNSRNGAYANHVIPFECVRVLAGFGPEPKRYYIPRATVDPPPELQAAIFPHLAESERLILSNGPEIAGKSLVDLLKYMRTVLLQDACVLMDLRYEHPAFCHPVFSTELFKSFKAELLEKVRTTTLPQHELIQQAMPLLAEDIRELRTQTARLEGSVNAGITMLTEEVRAASRRQYDQCSSMLGAALIDAGARIQNVQSHGTCHCSRAQELERSEHASNLSVGSIDTPTDCTQQESVPALPSRFRMSRQLHTVRQVWTEYSHGFPPNPSVRLLERRFGTAWGKVNADTKFFFRRKHIYDAIELVLTQEPSTTESDVITYFEELRHDKSLRWLSDKLKQTLTEYKSKNAAVTFRSYLSTTTFML